MYAHIHGVNTEGTIPMDIAMPEPRRRLRKPTNVSLPTALVAQATELGVNISRACEYGLAEAVAEARRLKWLEDNREAFDYWNRDMAENGLPLDKYRQF
jgi:antitoxin CcdA